MHWERVSIYIFFFVVVVAVVRGRVILLWMSSSKIIYQATRRDPSSHWQPARNDSSIEEFDKIRSSTSKSESVENEVRRWLRARFLWWRKKHTFSRTIQRRTSMNHSGNLFSMCQFLFAASFQDPGSSHIITFYESRKHFRFETQSKTITSTGSSPSLTFDKRFDFWKGGSVTSWVSNLVSDMLKKYQLLYTLDITNKKKQKKLTRNTTQKNGAQSQSKPMSNFDESNIITCAPPKTPPPLLVTPLLLRNHKTRNSRLLVSSKHHPIHRVDLHLFSGGDLNRKVPEGTGKCRETFMKEKSMRWWCFFC